MTRRARQRLNAAQTIAPENAQGQHFAATLELFTGQHERSEARYRQLLAAGPGRGLSYPSAVRSVSALAYLQARRGDRAGADASLAEAARLDEEASRKMPDQFEPIYDLAAVHALRGQADEALACLQRAAAAGWHHHRSTRLDPRFESLAQDRRFLTLLAGWEGKVAQMRHDADVAFALRP